MEIELLELLLLSSMPSIITIEGKVVVNEYILELIKNQILLDSRKGCYSILTVFNLVFEGIHVNNLYFARITLFRVHLVTIIMHVAFSSFLFSIVSPLISSFVVEFSEVLNNEEIYISSNGDTYKNLLMRIVFSQ